MSLKTINRNIGEIRRSGAALNDKIAATALLILEHARDHGDCTPALKLVKAMPASFRRRLLINWFANFSPIGMDVASDKVNLRKPEAKAYKPFDLDGARANPWHVDPEGAPGEDLPNTLADTDASIIRLADRLQRKLDDNKVDPDSRDAVAARVTALRALAA